MKYDRLTRTLAPVLLAMGALAPPVHGQTGPTLASGRIIDAPSRKAVIESLIAKVTPAYVFPERVPAIAKTLRRKLTSGAYDSISDPKAFAKAVSNDIEEVANDRHLRLVWSDNAWPPLGSDDRPTAAAIAQMKAEAERQNFFIPKLEVLDGNIGYMKMNLFADAQFAGPTFAAAMAFLQHTDALIFDLRENHGGDPGLVAMAVSYLVPPDTKINAFHRRGQEVDDQMWSLPYVPGGRWSTDKPVFVLTSKQTGSGAEEFAYDIQQMKRGTIIGESTWGGANPGEVVPIDQHFGVFVPVGAAVNPISKANWEGTGVKPDVPVDAGTALVTARQMALDKLLMSATGNRKEDLLKLRQQKPAS